MSDRIAVIYDGNSGILDPAETNKQDLGILMAGGQLNKDKQMSYKIGQFL